MARQSRKLSALEVGRLKEIGKHPVGEGLYLQISKSGSKSWLFRYSIGVKSTWMGLGSYNVVSLADARAKSLKLRGDLVEGINPLIKKNQIEREQRLNEAKQITFDECAKQYIEAHKPSWKNPKHISQWENTIKTYVSPIFGGLSIQDVDTALVMKVLTPIWYTKTETADRLRGRIERIMSWATVQGYRVGQNPALWRGHLDNLLPKRNAVQKIEHYKALPFKEVGEFMVKLRLIESVSSMALEFTILTATRTSEALNARWEEFNFAEKYWLIPAERMKAGKEHKVPLSERTIQILKHMEALSFNEFVFPGKKKAKPLSNMAMLQVIRGLGHTFTTHGFRSSFRDWASESTNYPSEVVEMALAHSINNKVEAAYRRGDLFDKRKRLMEDWAAHCLNIVQKSAKIIELTEYQVHQQS